MLNDVYKRQALQNEIIHILGNYIVANITKKCTQHIQGVQDISGHEQECVCGHWCDDNLEHEESFMSFYKTRVTCGSGIVYRLFVMTDLLYDGAGNMSGINKGVQTNTRVLLGTLPRPIWLCWRSQNKGNFEQL